MTAIEQPEALISPITHTRPPSNGEGPKRVRPFPMRGSVRFNRRSGNGAAGITPEERIVDLNSKPGTGRVSKEKDRVPSETEMRELDAVAKAMLRGTDGLSEAIADNSDLRAYLTEISHIPLLTREEEVRFAQTYERGRKAASELGRILPITPEERNHLEEERIRGLKAREDLIQGNLRLVAAVAKHYMGRGLPLLDLIQEGNIGLMRAVEKFEWEKGFKFSTYATWWIRQGVTRAFADQARTIRIPVHIIEQMNRYLRIIPVLAQELGREPTSEEAALAVGLPAKMGPEIERLLKTPLSLESPLNPDEPDGEKLSDHVPSDNQLDAYDLAAQTLVAEGLYKVLGTLTGREQRVLELRFGLRGNREMTLEEAGRKLGVTKERIRQIEAKALRKLRSYERRAKLRKLR